MYFRWEGFSHPVSHQLLLCDQYVPLEAETGSIRAQETDKEMKGISIVLPQVRKMRLFSLIKDQIIVMEFIHTFPVPCCHPHK